MENNLIPKHIAIIMDGNRRWAKEKGYIAQIGHKKGAEVLERTIKYCNDIGIKYLTVYAFSTENWKRTEDEISTIMILFEKYLDKFIEMSDLENIKLRVLGNVEELPEKIREKIEKMYEKTKNNTGLNFNIAFNYGGRDELVRATKKIAQDVLDKKIKIEDIKEETISNNLYTYGQDDPDLVIRTSGELRISNFLPWQIAYAEFLFLDKYWPEFTNDDIDKAIENYSNRHRRKGK